MGLYVFYFTFQIALFVHSIHTILHNFENPTPRENFLSRPNVTDYEYTQTTRVAITNPNESAINNESGINYY